MHEFSLLRDLLAKIGKILDEEGAARAVLVKVRIGALAHISAGHFREHFEHAVRGTRLEGTALDIEVSVDQEDPRAMDILLESVEVE